MAERSYLYRHPQALRSAVFIERPHRFAVVCVLEGSGERIEAHLADPGRLKKLLVPGVRVWVSGPFGPPRKLPWSAVLVESDAGVLVNLVTGLGNALFEALLYSGHFGDLPVGTPLDVEREVSKGDSRLDFLIHGDEGSCFVEVKSVTMRGEGTWGRFPDAPSARACRHVGELKALVEQGQSAAVAFVVGRSDVDRVGLARDIDSDFAEAMQEAAQAGVMVSAVRVSFDRVGAFGPCAVPFFLD